MPSRIVPPIRSAAVEPITGDRVLVMVGDSVTTDHISPAGEIKPDSPAGQYLQQRGVTPPEFNSYGSRRGNDRVMTRGTFANIRLRNLLALTGQEVFDFAGLSNDLKPGQDVEVRLTDPQTGSSRSITVTLRLDTPVEVNYYRNGGILPTVLRKLATS